MIIYNKYQEENELKYKEKLLREENYELKPLAIIQELGIKLYSRCMMCNIDSNCNLVSLSKDDNKYVNMYFSR